MPCNSSEIWLRSNAIICVYITRKSIFNNFNLPEKFSFETDFLEKHLDSLKICAMRCNEYFIDIGVPLDFEKAKRELPAKEIG